MIIVSVNVAIFLGLGTWLTPERMAGDLPGYISGFQGADEFTTRGALRLASEASDRTVVVVLGASAVRECLDVDDLRKEFATFDPVVYNLATGRQSVFDSIALASCLPDGANGVVILGIGASRLTRPKSILEEIMRSPRLGIRSDVVEEMAQEQGVKVPPRVGNYAADNVRFFAPRIKFLAFRKLTGWPLVYRQHWYLNRPQQNGKPWLDFSSRVAGRFGDYDQNVSYNLDLIERLVSVIRERTHMQILLVEHPINPRFVREFMDPDLVRKHREHVTAFATRLGLPVLDMGAAARLEEDEYYDWCHLRDREAITRCAAAVAEQVTPLMKKGGDE